MRLIESAEFERPNYLSVAIDKQRKSINALTLSGRGDPLFTFDNTAAVIGKFIKAKGISTSGHTFGVYYLNRDIVGVDNEIWDVCFPINDLNVTSSEEIILKTFPKSHVLSTTIVGGYNYIGSALKYLNAIAKANLISVSWPLTEIYIKRVNYQ